MIRRDITLPKGAITGSRGVLPHSDTAQATSGQIIADTTVSAIWRLRPLKIEGSTDDLRVRIELDAYHPDDLETPLGAAPVSLTLAASEVSLPGGADLQSYIVGTILPSLAQQHLISKGAPLEGGVPS